MKVTSQHVTLTPRLMKTTLCGLNEANCFLGLASNTEGDAVDLARADRDELGPRGVRWVGLIQFDISPVRPMYVGR